MSGLEPLVALSLACSIFQVITFSCDAIAIFRKVLSGSSPDPDLDKCTSQLSQSVERLQESLTNAGQPMNRDDQNLFDIANACLQANIQLRDVIPTATQANSGGARFRSAVKVSAKMIWRKSQIKIMEKELLRCQSNLKATLLQQTYLKSNALAISQERSFMDLDGTLRHFIEAYANGESEISRLVLSESASTKIHVTQEASKVTEDVKSSVGAEIARFNDTVIVGMKNLKHEAKEEARRQKFVDSLRYPTMFERMNQVSDPHTETYTWIFKKAGDEQQNVGDKNNDPRPNFTNWLKSSSGIFWIKGKAGSGKSTLMKFISEDYRTKDCLREWGEDVRIVSHYIWNSGDRMQRSIHEILCSILYQVLLHHAELVEPATSLLPKRLHHISPFGDTTHSNLMKNYTDWSIRDLKTVLFRLPSRRFCIFLDGLDEIASEDGLHSLLQLVHELSDLGHIKVCVSSRPDPILHEELWRHPSMKLEDLTRSDIHDYVGSFLKSMFEDTNSEKWLNMDRDAFRDLVWHVTIQADGVFLWVHLVLRNIKKGVSKGDDLTILYQRLMALPADLDSLYRTMWLRHGEDEKLYAKKAAQCFNLVLLGQRYSTRAEYFTIRDLTLALNPSFVDDIIRLKAPVQLRDPMIEHITKRCQLTISDIENVCGGLIETTPLRVHKGIFVNTLDGEVKFIHRTARDFLVDTEYGNMLLSYDSSTGDERCENMLGTFLVKWHFRKPRHRFLRDYHNGVKELVYLAHRLGIDEKLSSQGYIRLLESLNQAHKMCIECSDEVLDKSISIGLSEYVCYKLEELFQGGHLSTSRLKDVFRCLCVKDSDNVEISGKVEILNWILAHGFDPEAKLEMEGAWMSPLNHILHSYGPYHRGADFILHMSEVLIQAGGRVDLEVIFTIYYYNPFRDPSGIYGRSDLSLYLPHHHSSDFERMKNILGIVCRSNLVYILAMFQRALGGKGSGHIARELSKGYGSEATVTPLYVFEKRHETQLKVYNIEMSREAKRYVSEESCTFARCVEEVEMISRDEYYRMRSLIPKNGVPMTSDEVKEAVHLANGLTYT